jgi:hypothetical protein
MEVKISRGAAAILAAVSSALLIGCAAPAPALQTASGRPEVAIQAAQKKQVIDHLVSNLATHGFQIRSATEYSVTATKSIDSAVMRALYSSRMNGNPEWRHIYTVVDVPGGVRLLGRVEAVTNPGTAFESADDFTPQLGQQMQQDLNKFAGEFAR